MSHRRYIIANRRENIPDPPSQAGIAQIKAKLYHLDGSFSLFGAHTRVTGATRGIGAGICGVRAHVGANIAASARYAPSSPTFL